MRVAFVTECYRPVRNGIVSVIDTLTEQLRRRGHEVIIISPKHPKADENKNWIIRIPSLPNPFYPDYPIAVPWANQLPKALEEFKPDIIHTHSFMWLSRFALKHAKRLKVPVVTTYHTLVTEYLHYAPLPRFISRKLITYCSASFCNACEVVIIVSPLAEELLRSFGVKSQIEFIPTGIDAELFGHGNAFRIRKELNIPPNATVLLYVGRIAVEKNIAFLLDAVGLILSKRPRVYLLLVGDGPALSKMKTKASNLQYGDRILFVGSRSRNEIPDFLASADIFVFASTTETQGLSVAEAMMAGLPVVAVGEGGIRFFIKDGEVGFLTPQEKFGFAQSVLTLVDKPHLKISLGEKAKLYARQTFSLDTCIDRLETVYYRILAGVITKV